jgi:2-polyprenyl-6-methoxyphenol hydroxylase-like FAD-dependent oxidoreductase
MINDVVIAGAGPNGLMLACELGLAGVRPIVLERLPEPGNELRANGLVGQVVRMLDRRGLHERLSGSKEPPTPVPGFVFGALPLDLTALEDNPIYLLPVPQARITQVLAERAVELGVEIRRGHELTDLEQDGDAVTATVAGPDGPYRLRARYLVGADGGHSVTRKRSGIGFPGVSRDDIVSRTVTAHPPAAWVDPATRALDVPGYGVIPPFLHHRTERGLFVFGPFQGREPLVTTLEWERPTDEAAPMTMEEMRASIRRVLGVDVPLDPPNGAGPHLLRRLSGGNTRLAERYRDGRVLLVGDAAHVHSAIGGPGLNLGLQDTVNLGWKLAAEVRGWAPDVLLDSYQDERRLATARNMLHAQAQIAIRRGHDVAAVALRDLFQELLLDDQPLRRLGALMAGSDVRYPFPGHDQNPLIGTFAPDLALQTDRGETTVAELMHGARPFFLDLADRPELREIAEGWRRRVDVHTAETDQRPADALLVRPDAHVAWAATVDEPTDTAAPALREALSRWFGTP